MSIRLKHYKKQELEIARRYLATLKGFQKIESDVRLYPDPQTIPLAVRSYIDELASRFPELPKPQLEDLKQSEIKMLLDLKSLKIDLVVHYPLFIDIVEVKDRARPSAIGQLETYAILYKKQYPTFKMIRKILVCEQGDPLVEEACKKLGISVVIV